MNEQDLRRFLTDIANQEIPDEMDLWNDIQSQLGKRKTKPKRGTRRRFIGAIVAVIAGIGVALSIVLNTAGTQPVIYASGDAGIIAASQANLMKPLNLVEHIEEGDILVLVPWAYADGHRISMQYVVDYPIALKIPTQLKATLRDESGNVFPFATFLRGGGGGGGGGEERTSFGSTLSFDATHITDNPETLDLILTLEFSDDPDQANTPYGGDMGGSGGGGGGSGSGGGGGDGDTNTEATATPQPSAPPFTVEFSFSVPFIPAVKVENIAPVTANDVTMTLTDFSYAPSATLGRLCFNPPNTGSWMPGVYIEDPSPQNVGLDFIKEETTPLDPSQTCGELVLMGMTPPTDTLLFQIDRLVSDPSTTPERIEWFKHKLEEQGFKADMAITEGSGFSFSITEHPPELGDDYYTVVNRIYEQSFYDVIEGPWVFRIDLTQ